MDEIQKLIKKGENEKAVSLLVKRINQQPNELTNYVTLGTLLTVMQDYDQGMALYEKSLHKFPASSSLRYGQGILFYQTGELTKAVSNFRLLLTDDVLKQDATYMLGISYLALNQPAKALAFALTASELEPDRLDAIELVGQIYFQLGLFSEASDVADQLLVHDQHSVQGFFLSGISQLFMGNIEIATKQFKQADKINHQYVSQQAVKYAAVQQLLDSKK